MSEPENQLLFIKEQKKHFIDPFDETFRNLWVSQIEIMQNASALSNSYIKFAENLQWLGVIYWDCGFLSFPSFYESSSNSFHDYSDSLLAQSWDLVTRLSDILTYHH